MKKTLESFKKFSESALWKFQEEAYKEYGPSAWSEKGIPFYLTSNPWTVDAYFNTVRGFIHDLIEKKVKGPLYIIDLGAGSGRFGYLFLKALRKYAPDRKMGLIDLCYVMTDMAEKNLAFLKSHPLLQNDIDEGFLQFAFFKHNQNEESLVLYPSKKKLQLRDCPLVLMANYYFDTVPQELYRVQDGVLLEGHVAIEIDKSMREPEVEWIPKLELIFKYAQGEDIRQSPWKAVLEKHLKELEGNTFLFPVGALETIAFFKEKTSAPCLLLSGDQAFSTLEQLKTSGEPKLALHSTFSLHVSYYTIKQYIEKKGGQVLFPLHPDPAFTNMGAILSQDSDWKWTKGEFNSAFTPFSPWDYWKLVERFEKTAENLSDYLLLLRLGKGDPMTFYANFEKIRALVKDATPNEKQLLIDLIELAADQFFPVGAFDADFLTNLGELLIDLRALDQAKALLEKALKYGARKPSIFTLINKINYTIH